VNRPQRFAVPDHRGFPLVGNAHGSDAVRREVGGGQRLAQDTQGGLPDHLRFVLDPPRPGIDLGELGIRIGDDAARRIDDQNT